MAQQTTAKYSIRQAISHGKGSSGRRADKKIMIQKMTTKINFKYKYKNSDTRLSECLFVFL